MSRRREAPTSLKEACAYNEYNWALHTGCAVVPVKSWTLRRLHDVVSIGLFSDVMRDGSRSYAARDVTGVKLTQECEMKQSGLEWCKMRPVVLQEAGGRERGARLELWLW